MKKILFIVAVATLFFSCKKELEPTAPATDRFTFKASIEQLAEPTKADINAANQLVWATGDKIGIYVDDQSWTDKNQPFTLSSGAGTTQGEFSWDNTGTFSDKAAAAFFPWEGTGSDKNNVYGGIMYFKLHDAYYEYSSGKMLTPLVASLNGSTDPIHFKHVGAAVKVTINNLPAGAHSIGMEVNGQQISGNYQINPEEAGSASLALDGSVDNTKNSLWLNFEPSASEREFTFVFPVPTLTKPKLSFKIYDKNDILVWSKNLKAQTSDLGRSDVLVMPATDITAYAQFKTFSEEWTVIGTANGSNWDVDFPMKTDGNVCIAKGLPFEANGAFKLRKNGAWDESFPSSNYVVSEAGTYDIIFDPSATKDEDKLKVVVSGECPYPETPLRALALAIKTVWLKQSEGSSAWNTYYGGTGGSDRNIAMDDDYVYVAENTGTAKLWAISITNPANVTAVNVQGVTGGTHLLACPRVIKNTDQNVNGGKDVLICSNLTRGGEDPKLYMWINGINNAPKAITLTTYATGAWYGDVFTVYGTLQDGVLFFDKIGGEGANGVVTFLLKGVPGNAMYLQARLMFNDAFGSHTAACAYYPYPDNIQKGVYSPGRGREARGQNVVATEDIKGTGGINVALTPLDYDEGTNGYVLGYNFIEWKGKRYVIYGNQPNSNEGYIRVREGSMDTDWSVIASTGSRLYRRDLTGSLSSGNSGMDITARVINGELYFAGQKQNVACGLYKLVYE